MSDVVMKLISGNPIRNGSYLVGKGAPSNFTGNYSSGVSYVNIQAPIINHIPSLSGVVANLDGRFDDRTYYST